MGELGEMTAEEAARRLSPPCAEHGGPAPRLLTDEERQGVRDRLDELAAANFYDHQRYAVRDELVRIARGLDLALVAREREVAELTAAMPTRQCMVCEDDVRVDELTAGVCDDCAAKS